jgi:large subunit ribosomal protein L25
MTTNEKFKLSVQSRTVVGNPVRKLRRDKILPAVVFGNKVSSTNLQTSLPEFTKLYKLAGKTHIIEINNTDTGQKMNVLVNNLDIDPVKGGIRHIDFLAVNLSEKVVVLVPLVLVGESEAVKSQGAVVVSSMDEVEVECYPDKIPEQIEVDLSKLQTIDDVIRVENLPKSNDYTIVADPEQTVVSLATETVEEESQEQTPEIGEKTTETGTKTDKK